MSNDVTNRFSEWLNSLEPNQIEAISSSILEQEGAFNLIDFYENSDIFSAEQKNAFTELMTTHQIEFLGGNNSKNFKVKNIYEFLATQDGCIGQGRVNAHDYLTNNITANTFDFSDPVFQNPIGFRYQMLVCNLVTEKPELRMSVSDATQSLAAIDSLQKNPQLLDRFYQLGNENYQINMRYNQVGLQAPPITSIDIGARINDPKLTAIELQTIITTIEAHNQNLISDLNNRQAAKYSSFREQFANARPSDNAPVNEETQKNDLSP